MKMKSALLALITLLSTAAGSLADFIVTPGNPYSVVRNDLLGVADVSPGYPAYNLTSFSLVFIDNIYQSPPDDLRIYLYENQGDASPVYTIFGPDQNAPNLTVSSTQVNMNRAPGTLWHDGTGMIKVEALDGSVKIDHLFIDVGISGTSYTRYIEAVPEPSSLALLLIGAGALRHYRRRRNTAIVFPRRSAVPALESLGNKSRF